MNRRSQNSYLGRAIECKDHVVRRCNGVFKGGGAKGVAYVGALEACAQFDLHFDAVAGSSAGAITAVLVASGFDATELRSLMPEALATIESPLRAAFGVGRSSLLSNDRLRDWLDRILVEQLAHRNRVPANGSRCTFSTCSTRPRSGSMSWRWISLLGNPSSSHTNSLLSCLLQTPLSRRRHPRRLPAVVG